MQNVGFLMTKLIFSFREFYGLTDAIKPGDMYGRGGRGNFHLYLHSPNTKQMLEANENVHPDNVSSDNFLIILCVW